MAATQTNVSTPMAITAPTDPLQNIVARVSTHLHPFLVLGLFYTSMHSTILNPVESLSRLLIKLCVVQMVNLLLYLRPATTSRAQQQTSGNSKLPLQQQRRKNTSSGTSQAILSNLIPSSLSLVLALFVGTPVLTIALILHGAPLNTQFLHTGLCAAHLSILALPALFYVHGVNSARWRELCGFLAPIDGVSGAAIGTIAGAWLGAIPIPLDWDRDWQKWPVTVVTGAYLGYTIGKFTGETILKGRRFAIENEGEAAEEEMRLAIDP